ncbi:hypothetical protein [Methanosarcina horonobensis]|uniref:hypothetical protein n=1 Tax=Methanosarcina horonobensis TaxID=418008 RepID=UPI000A9996B9|nr:hypothetical protein [Methanosarcina horonobensis]
MADMVKSFRELTPELQATAGGKGGTLARLFQAGYPVPAASSFYQLLFWMKS